MESCLVQDLWEFPQCESHLGPKPKPISFPVFLDGGMSNPLSPPPSLRLALPSCVCIKQPGPALPSTCPKDRLHSAGLGLQSCPEVAPKCLQMKGHILSSHPSLPNLHMDADNNYTAQNAQREHSVWVRDPKTHKFQEETNKTSTLNSIPTSFHYKYMCPPPVPVVHITAGCRGNDREGAEGHLRSRGSQSTLQKSLILPNVRGHTRLLCRFFTSGAGQRGYCSCIL